MHEMKRPRVGRVRLALVAAALVALLAAGGASAYALAHTVMLSPGHCKKVHGQKVCARNVKAKTVVQNHTATATVAKTATQTVTVTASPSPIGKTFSGPGDETLPPLTIPGAGDTVKWTSQPYTEGGGTFNSFSVFCGNHYFDNGGGADGGTSGSTFLPAGTYTCNITADDNGWTLSF
jgi:hypothetical protein